MPTLWRNLVILKKNDREQWGIPYQGSKSKVISRISKYFPNADHFYDLFGGGFSVTHYMITMRKNSYKQFHYNELRPGLPELIQDAINGKYNFDVFKPEWISRERFEREKETNPYIKIIWSFGNNGRTYIFGKDIEKEKHSMHQAVVFDEFDEFMENTFGLTKWPNKLDITGKRLLLKKYVNQRIELEQLQQLERLEQLERLQQLQQLEFTNLDYRKVKIEPNSVIYCDIPYKGTADYGNQFSHSAFFDWAAAQENALFISEYKVDDPRFFLLKEFSHRSIFSNGENNAVTERLYGNKVAFDLIEKARRK